MLDVTEDSKVRFSAARVVARQNLFDLGRGFATNFTRNATTNLFEYVNGTAGNPELEPYRATQFDLSYEWYFGTQGLVSAAYFWKEVDSFPTQVTESVFVMDQAGGRFGPVTRPINGEGGDIKGFEIGAQYAFDWGGGFARQLHLLGLQLADVERRGFEPADPGRAGAHLQRTGVLSEVRLRGAAVMGLARQVVRVQLQLRRPGCAVRANSAATMSRAATAGGCATMGSSMRRSVISSTITWA